MSDQYTFRDPSQMYADFAPQEVSQPGAGLDSGLRDPADLGADTYRGSGRLRGRKALITGGDSGIGAATAIAYAREGADVAISYLAEEESDADAVAKLVTAAGQKVVKIPGDVTDAAHCRSMVQTAVDGLGGLDAVVVNAGKQQFVERIEDISDEEFDATVKTNVYAMFWIVKAAIPHLPPGSTIIGSSSIQAYAPSPHLIHYAMTKASINTFLKGLSQQVADRGIRVNVVAPGPVWTPLQTAGGQPTEQLPEVGGQTPLGRWGQPAELAPAYVFLASAESSFVVGETLHVNGGMPTP
ncbi:SDR family oxidoreductase [Mycobacterium yunnanensis]|uniref:SDR family oxidoreductase n=1 Tax=Mycobacterium yunnanensis TaxID=368477 RepID=A0A9X2YZU8_9MYCO|nr:SDR family oxidoreductase [Mycobacterium yunnanensis]MCV7420555.1 SDR family oxidoreductase [Mycobacterium yunnanensis]